MKKFFDFTFEFLTIHLNTQDVVGIEMLILERDFKRASFFGVGYSYFYNIYFIDILWFTFKI